jgi:thiamine pyrophosphokinase
MKCVIVGGADIRDYERAASYVKHEDYVIYCDSGLKHQKGLKLAPSLVIGDFDSFGKPYEGPAETITLPREKDDTDSMYAIKEGIKRGYDSFLLLGVTGNRFDHSFVNIAALLMLDSLGKKAKIVDDYCEMEVISTDTTVPHTYPYFSLLNISGEKNEVSITDAKFPMNRGSISSEYQFAVSNEPIAKKDAKITLHKGRVLLVKDFK